MQIVRKKHYTERYGKGERGREGDTERERAGGEGEKRRETPIHPNNRE